ncbi:MAG: hypothetical protein K9N23_00490 [Akkermansiaceae bacterium]|nr:hypothetical protein [Akkermansiaceae bacterium]
MWTLDFKLTSKIKNQKSKIKNQKSKIKNQKSKIKNQKSSIGNHKSSSCPSISGGTLLVSAPASG